MGIENQIEYIIKNYKALEDENKKLRQELKFYKLDSESLDDLLADEEVILNNNLQMIDNITKRFVVNTDKINKKAVLIGIADSSGSMGIWEKYMGRAYMTWVKSILTKKYSSLESRFVLHTEIAKEVSEEEFFTKGESGGTISSKGLRLANSIIEEFDYEDGFDIYLVYVSDGDNLTSDCSKVFKLIENRLLNKVKTFTYLEVNQYNRHSTLMSNVFRNLRNEKLNVSVVKSKKDIKSSVVEFVNQVN
jgi:uncharacterized sporulation protein YeaH/YhbH (DUF444 family)